jgi:hypothetical protein
MNFLKTNFLPLIILLLVVILFIDRCSEKRKPIAQPTIVHDTVLVNHTGTTISVPHLINSVPYPIERLTREIKYIPDTNYKKLLIQYQNLLELYLLKNIQKDSLKIDSIGYVSVTDTITKNLISNRNYSYNLHYPIITNTITLPAKPRNQMYIGGALQGNPGALINQINAGLLWKNKKDQIFGGYIGVNGNATFNYGIQSYWKINLRRK